MFTEFTSLVLFIIVLALLGYASYLKMRLVRIEDKANRADKSIARHKREIEDWIAYADFLESGLSRYSTEYAEVRLDYDIVRGKVKAAPIKANGTKAYALTLPGMALPSDCEVLFDESPERLGALVVNRKSEQKNKNGNNKTAKSEKIENSPDSSAKSSNGANAAKRDPQSIIAEIEKTTGKLESHEADRVVTWLKSTKTSDKPVAEYVKWIAGIRKSKK